MTVDFYWSFVPTSVSAIILLSFLAGVFWLFTSWASNRRGWLYPGLLVAIVILFLNPKWQPEYQLPHMNDANGGESYYRHRTPLTHYQDTAHPERSLRERNEAGLLADAEVLEKWHERMLTRYREPQPIVVVTVSGGASASALYTADVLFTLEEQFPGFSDRVRIISGASGGMLGAAYFITQLLPGGILDEVRKSDNFLEYLRAEDEARRKPSDPAAKQRVLTASMAYTEHMQKKIRPEFFRGLEQDFLGPLVQKWIHHDAPLFFVPRPTSNDRGAALEAAWSRHLKGSLDIPFRTLKEQEKTRTIPSLIFTPMIIEDGRQLIISNLDLDYMVDAGSVRSQNLGAGAAAGSVAIADGPQASPQDSQASHMAIEFFRLFPHADQFRLSTAVRMNASFPYLSPSSALPTDPVRHIVDAGYYDNYGTTAATKWIARNAGWLSSKYADAKLAASKPPEVILLRIRCFGYEEDSRRFVTGNEIREFGRETGQTVMNDEELLAAWKKTPPTDPVRTEGGLFSLTAPVFSLFSAWHANMVYRADERVGAAAKILELDAALRELRRRLDPTDQRIRSVRISPFIAECQVNPSLNWALRADTIARIHADVEQNLAFAAMVVNFHNNRSPAPPGLVGGGVVAATVAADAGVQAVEQRPAFKAAPPSARQGMESQARSVERLGRLKLPDLAVIEAERKKPR